MPDADRLLNLLTARGRIRMPALREVLPQLAPNASRDAFEAYKVARQLDMLGHAEFHPRPRPGTLFFAPSCLVRLPTIESHRYVLCGARTDSTVVDIVNAAAQRRARVTVLDISRNGSHPFVPRRILVDCDCQMDAAALSQSLDLHFSDVPSAWALACLSTDMGLFEHSLEWRPRTFLDDELQFYDEATLSFTATADHECAGGLARPVSSPGSAFVVERDREARVEDLDWGRYWALARSGAGCLQYDARRRFAAVPAAAPLPRLLARALCLCSAYPPVVAEAGASGILRNRFVFRDVPEEIAEKVAVKLGLRLALQPILVAEG